MLLKKFSDNFVAYIYLALLYAGIINKTRFYLLSSYIGHIRTNNGNAKGKGYKRPIQGSLGGQIITAAYIH